MTMSESGDIFKRDLLAVLPGLRAFAVSLCGNVDLADDLMQDAILKAWAAQDSFRTGTNIRAWVFTILRNEFYSLMRKRGREIQDSEGYLSENLAVPPSQNGVLDLQDFSKALAELPEDQREALLLVGASGFAYEEAAEICGCRVGTIKSRVSRARSKLQETLNIDDETKFGPDAAYAPVVLRSFAS
jgi:RNA polymerase sigma-70 factor, ECF subfamily